MMEEENPEEQACACCDALADFLCDHCRAWLCVDCATDYNCLDVVDLLAGERVSPGARTN